ncbi:hypothetical protein LASUN_13510 [Lentilactobacillus sunkii]|jgi:hypothetical protein|uniref:Uncharacterized protein n=1 Tax=Lentilactobacillus sunkii TaxID=481719 RepID=A0A1E7XCP6_9LACO|nr:hypothetical protein [Lentilactobacillus sunkii]OFA10801.1 hypothetical protein LASUN_13510 [Lentilactobacillus sunkii]
MKTKNTVLLGIASLTLGGLITFSGSSTASAHTWWDGTPSNVRGYWRTRQVYIPAYGFSTHAAFKAKAHSVTFMYTQSAPFHLTGTYWRKTGAHSYTIHGAWAADSGVDHRLTVKKLSRNVIRIYIDGHKSTRSTPFPNKFYRG